MDSNELLKLLEENIIVVQDPVDLEKVVECKAIYVELDEGFTFIYLRAIEDENSREKSMNDKWEPKLGTYIHTVVELSMLADNINCYIKYTDNK